jgi:replicative DNA helicase
MMNMERQGKPIDIVTLPEVMGEDGELQEVGGSFYLTELAGDIPSTSNIEHYAKIVKEKSVIRKTILTAQEIFETGLDGVEDPEKYLDHAEKSILQISHATIKSGFTDPKTLALNSMEMLEELHNDTREITGTSTGFDDLDRMTSGLHKSDLVVLAARPGLGKTSLALNLASHVALRESKYVGMFSLEMSEDQLMMRLLSMRSKVNFSKIRGGNFNEGEMERLAEAATDFSKTNLYIDDTPGLTVREVRAKARRLFREHGLDFLIVDYLQLMRGNEQSREREIAEISGGLKSLAKELHIPVLALSQLSRASEQRPDHRPQLSDLRESGAIEQDADMVMFIHRPDVYRKNPEDKDGTAQIIIGKQRNGPTGTVELAFLECLGVPSFENLILEDL